MCECVIVWEKDKEKESKREIDNNHLVGYRKWRGREGERESQ